MAAPLCRSGACAGKTGSLVGCGCAGCPAPGGGVTSCARLMSQAVSSRAINAIKSAKRNFMIPRREWKLQTLDLRLQVQSLKSNVSGLINCFPTGGAKAVRDHDRLAAFGTET